MKTPESLEKADIRAFLASLGDDCFFFNPMMNGYGKTGIPDIVCCIKGVFWGIEVKREGKEPTPIQDRRMLAIRAAGGVATAGTARVVISDIRRWLKDRRA